MNPHGGCGHRNNRIKRVILSTYQAASGGGAAAIDPATGYNDEETKVIRETRKIFEDDRMRLAARGARQRS